MKLKIKDEHLDTLIFCPFTYKDVLVRFIGEDMYKHYNSKGFSHLFEEDSHSVTSIDMDKPKKVVKKEEPTNDISS